MSVRVFAPAKINLTLEVGPPAANGRHPLQSLVAFADIGDWIEAAPADGLSLRVQGQFANALADEADNLVLRAARALAAAHGVDEGAALTLEKNLPVAAGMGGGSADAAATLKALRTLWALDCGDDALMRAGAALGGDVPVCVRARAALMRGEGEQVAPLALPPLDAVLVNPGIAVSTSAVFRRFDARGDGAPIAPLAAAPSDCAGVAALIRARGNHLVRAAIDVAPEIADVQSALALLRGVLVSGMSGSGATMFALVADGAAAHALAGELRARFPRWWVAPARLG